MRYFQKFPTINYQTTEIENGVSRGLTRIVPNMTVRLQSTIEMGAYEWYKIQDRDRPDLLAAEWYGSSQYAWVILLSNDMRDLYDWPMSNLEFHDYIAKKYQTFDEEGIGQNDGVAESQNTIYQYLWNNPDTNQELVIDLHWYQENNPDAIPPAIPAYQKRSVSVYAYETQLNDKRRDIKRLYPETFQRLLRQFEQVTGGV